MTAESIATVSVIALVAIGVGLCVTLRVALRLMDRAIEQARVQHERRDAATERAAELQGAVKYWQSMHADLRRGYEALRRQYDAVVSPPSATTTETQPDLLSGRHEKGETST